MLANSPKILYSFQLFVASLWKNSGLKEVEFRAVMNGTNYQPSLFMRTLMEPEHYIFHDKEYRIECFRRWFFEISADVVVFADADLIFMDRINDILEFAVKNEVICGCTAYGTPFRRSQSDMENSMSIWEDLYEEFGLTCRKWTKTLEGTDCPYGYFNGGFIVFPVSLYKKASAFREIIEDYHFCMIDVMKKFSQSYSCSPQVSNLFCFEKIGLPYLSIHPKYNCCVDEQNMPEDVRIIHMIGANWKNRWGLEHYLRVTRNPSLLNHRNKFMEIISDAELFSNCKLL